eukprot:2386764-Rhodomonas_salina.1
MVHVRSRSPQQHEELLDQNLDCSVRGSGGAGRQHHSETIQHRTLRKQRWILRRRDVHALALRLDSKWSLTYHPGTFHQPLHA